MPRISSIVLPMISSVRSEALAIAALHPRVRNRASAIRPFSMRTARRKSSPHTGFVTFTVLVAPGRSPKLRGCSQWWSTTALYIIRVSQSDRRRATRRATLMDTAPSAVPTRLAKRASERFREIAVIKTKDDLLKQVGTALVKRPCEKGLAGYEPHLRHLRNTISNG